MKHVIIVKLEIEAASFSDAVDAVEQTLDHGVFQDTINEGAGVRVKSATCDAESGFAKVYKREAYEDAAKVADRASPIADVAARIRRLKP